MCVRACVRVCVRVCEDSIITQEEKGTLKFLISRQDLASIHSSVSSDSSSFHYNPSPTGISPSTGGPIYDEIVAPSGYQIGTPKSVCLKKVIYNVLYIIIMYKICLEHNLHTNFTSFFYFLDPPPPLSRKQRRRLV